MSAREKHLYEFGPFHLDTEECQLLHDGKPVPLTHKAFEMLRVLVENSGHVVAKDDFLNKIWPETFIEEGILTVNIANLRKALGEDRNAHRYIETVPRRGYRFVASVREVRHESAVIALEEHSRISVISEEETNKHEGEELTDHGGADLGQSASMEPRWWLRPTSWAVIVMIIGMPVALSYVWIRNKPNTIDPEAVRSIAVLPFKPLVSESHNEALEMGMADTLITKLSGIVVVRSLSSVRKYSAIDQDPIAAGRELQVDAVLDTSFQWDGAGRIRVTARLLRVNDGSAIWNDKFDEQFVDIFRAQDVMAERLAGVLTPRLTGEEKKKLTKHYTDSAEAYELYCKGLLFSNQASAEGYKKGLQFFEQAIKKDPAFALAHAGLANSYIRLGSRGLLPDEASWRKNAEATARRAVEIDDTLVEAHVSLGFAILHDWRFTAAETEFKRAIELDQDSEEACRRYSQFLWTVGRFDEGIAYAKRAREINPVSVASNSNLARAFSEAGLYDQAIDQYKQVVEIDPGFVPTLSGLAVAYAAKGMYKEAIVECKKAIAIDNSPQRRGQLTHLGVLYVRSGNRREAQKVLDELKVQASKQYLPPYNFALLYEALGDKNQAMAFLEKAYLERDFALNNLRKRGFDTLRSDPRFIDLLQRIDASIR